ncbi:hypothetical protein [Tateyamaria pelophila]|uniref:hypothetical protein n=1 Tax=Tateyamaria pelophila TaxID=328415 RepID=UPI001CBCED21|nr:hypothetical protein [Tateyamaria pelophila]
MFLFSSENRYDPDGAHYDTALIARYRAAQRDHVERIDTIAREMVRARKAAKAGAVDDVTAQTAGWQNMFKVPRTGTDLRNWHLTLDP